MAGRTGSDNIKTRCLERLEATWLLLVTDKALSQLDGNVHIGLIGLAQTAIRPVQPDADCRIIASGPAIGHVRWRLIERAGRQKDKGRIVVSTVSQAGRLLLFSQRKTNERTTRWRQNSAESARAAQTAR